MLLGMPHLSQRPLQSQPLMDYIMPRTSLPSNLHSALERFTTPSSRDEDASLASEII